MTPKIGRCFYCNKEVTRTQLMRCSRCRLVTYCTKECQTASWKLGHKLSCQPYPILTQENASKKAEMQLDKELSRWIDIWRMVLMTFAVVALDMANHPADRNITHCMVVILEPRDAHGSDPAKVFQMVNGEIGSCAELHSRFPGLGILDDPRIDDCRMRFIVVLQAPTGELRRLRCISWTQSLERHRTMRKDDSKAVAESWARSLGASINQGDVKTASELYG